MASVGFDGTIRVWDMNTMSVISVIEDRTSINDKDKKIYSLAWQYVQSS
jgi:WD40 repeat protein